MGYIASSSIKRSDIGVYLTEDMRNASFFYSPEQHLLMKKPVYSFELTGSLLIALLD